MTDDAAMPSPPRRGLSLDGWALLAAVLLTLLIWTDLLPPIGW